MQFGAWQVAELLDFTTMGSIPCGIALTRTIGMSIDAIGALSSSEIQAALGKAGKNPEKWTIYVVRSSGENRTVEQNRLFLRIKRQLAQKLGNDVSYWHRYLVERFLGFEDVEYEGLTVSELTHTSKLSVGEFKDFLDACLAFCAECQVS